jgi:hypothetical protein
MFVVVDSADDENPQSKGRRDHSRRPHAHPDVLRVSAWSSARGRRLGGGIVIRERDADERHDQQKHDAYEADNHEWPEKIAHSLLSSRKRRPPCAVSAHLQYIASASALLARLDA